MNRRAGNRTGTGRLNGARLNGGRLNGARSNRTELNGADLNGATVRYDRNDDHPPAPIRRWTLIAGLLIGLLVAAAGIGYAFWHPPTWTAEGSVVIVPDSSELSEQAALYDSLSHGQIAATAAEIYRRQQWHPDAPEVIVDAGVIPPSAVLQVTATGSDPDRVEQSLTEVLDTATAEINQVITPYRAVVLTPDTAQARMTGLPVGSWIGIAVLAGIFAAVAGSAFLNALARRLAAGSIGIRPITSPRSRGR